LEESSGGGNVKKGDGVTARFSEIYYMFMKSLSYFHICDPVNDTDGFFEKPAAADII